MNKYELFKKIYHIGSTNGYQLINCSERNYVMIFRRMESQINVYWNKIVLKQLETHKNPVPLFAVATIIDHPKKDRTQLIRKGISLKELDSIFKNPRVHTGKGYYKKK